MTSKHATSLSLLVLLKLTGSPAVAGPSCEFVSIAAGRAHSLAVNGDGRMLVWGVNNEGQLGLGVFPRLNELLPVPVPMLEGALTGAACPYTSFALSASPSPWAWGTNGGQFGDGTSNSSDVPVPSSGITGVDRLACGGGQVLALLNDGSFWGWGENGHDELGLGTGGAYWLPQQLSALPDVIDFAAGSLHTLAIRSDDSLWAWGGNEDGQVGTGSTSFAERFPAPVAALAGRSFLRVAGGSRHSLALENTGQVWAWGRNTKGQLGTGDNNDSFLPVLIPGLAAIRAVFASGDTSYAIDTTGQVWSWGYGLSGLLGNGAWLDSNVPLVATGLGPVASLAPGPNHVLALLDDATVWAWGRGTSGQLGDGLNTSSNVPVRVDFDAIPPVLDNVLTAVRSGNDVRLDYFGARAARFRLFDDPVKANVGTTPLLPASDTSATAFLDVGAVSRTPEIYYAVKGLSLCMEMEGP